jgi:outer membrane murein-binding lipoprotein Lpp
MKKIFSIVGSVGVILILFSGCEDIDKIKELKRTVSSIENYQKILQNEIQKRDKVINYLYLQLNQQNKRIKELNSTVNYVYSKIQQLEQENKKIKQELNRHKNNIRTLFN